MGYYANGYGYFEVTEEKDIAARFTDAMKDVETELKELVELEEGSRPVIIFRYYDSKYYEDEVLEILYALTPLVEEGSMMEFRGEDEALWAFILEDGEWAEHEGYVAYR